MIDLRELKLGVYEKAIPLKYNWDKKFAIAKEWGFDFIEVSIDGLQPRFERLNWSDSSMLYISKLSERYDMPFETMAFTANRYFPLGAYNEVVRNRGKEVVCRAVDIANKLGIRIIQLAPYDVNGEKSTNKSRANFKESIKEVLDYAENKEIILALEVLEDVPQVNTVKLTEELIKNFDSPYLKMYGDLGNTASIGITPQEDIIYGKSSIVACHIKDATPGCCRNVPFGEGIVDFDACFRAFKEMNYQGLFVAELWCDEDEILVPLGAKAASFIREKIRTINS